MKFYQCDTCKSIFTFVNKPTENLNCCGNPLKEIIPNSTNASLEKHIPVVERRNDHILVKVGSEPHPMLPEHYIEWVVLETTQGYQLRNLKPGDAPMAEFVLAKGEDVLTTYAYCNIHKLWKD
ncbi:MAG: hypothetical protein K2J85_01070 [Anaeroplasmataceae bacterium]|nr:hypothetical protein [Anaeroplasmataceae bacterium]